MIRQLRAANGHGFASSLAITRQRQSGQYQ
jgi:hypothetical protein